MIAHQKKSYLKKYLVTFHPNVNTSEEAYNTRVVKSMSVFVDQCNQKCSDNVVLINEIEMKFRNFYSSNTCTVKPRFIAPRFTAKLAYRQEFLQSRFPYVVITPLKCQTRIPPSATVIEDQTVNLLLFKPRS